MSESRIYPRITFHIGGPDFHPVEKQSALIRDWLGDSYQYAAWEDKAVFDHLEDTDLLVLMGLFYSGSNRARPGSYTPLDPRHEAALQAYVESGRPLLLHHGAIASYDDSEVFRRLIGINWIWEGDDRTAHSPIGDYSVTVPSSDHPVVSNIGDYGLFDELYYNLRVHPSFAPAELAWAHFEGRRLPMIIAGQGGRAAGAGKIVYLANGHDMRAFECAALRQLWINAVRWLLS